MQKRFEYKLIFFLIACIFDLFFINPACSQPNENTVENNELLSVNSIQSDNKITLHIKSTKPIVSTIYELPNPKRIVIDLANISISENSRKNIVIPFKYTIDTVKGTNPSIVRLELHPGEFDSFTGNQGQTELIVTINYISPNFAKNEPPSKGTETTDSPLVRYHNDDNKDFVTINTFKNNQKYIQNTTSVNSKYALQIDLNDITVSESTFGTINAGGNLDSIVVKKIGNGARILLISKDSKPFFSEIKNTEIGLNIIIANGERVGNKNKIEGKNNLIASQLPEINPLESKISPQAREQQMQDAFNFSGYNKDRITVEFQKMDLHNVFNFLRQVSGVNIVVDESVQGSLTLVLDDVPWDFALDIILNLKNLEKEERFNTIVIYPKGKGFKWPEQAENNLSFEADKSVIEKEALVVQQQEKQSPDRIEAKQILAKAETFEESGNIENSILLYEQAFEKWSDNAQIANKISSLYLGPLHQNAKSLYYSQKALTADPNNQFALLQAGIASANMQNFVEAEKFFARAVKGAKPSKEAFLNFAAFKEDRGNYTDSLSILSEHDRLFGKSMDSMLSAARVNDKAGNGGQAVRHYRELLNSGYRIPPDLHKFIQERVAH